MSRERAKGTRFETAVCEYLADVFPAVERRAQTGARDRGDIAGVPAFALEVKNCRAMELAAWLDEAATEAANANEPFGAVIHKRRNKATADAYVTMTLRDFAVLVELAVRFGAL